MPSALDQEGPAPPEDSVSADSVEALVVLFASGQQDPAPP